MSVSAPKSFSTTQKTLHWLVSAIIFEQLFFGESMGEAWDAFRESADVSGFLSPIVLFHIWGGLSVVAFAVWRLMLRKSRGVPEEPVNEAAWMKMAAKSGHIALYALMFFVPLSGAAAYFGGIDQAAGIHSLMKPVLIIVIVAHVGGGLYQHFIAKTDVLKRMTHG